MSIETSLGIAWTGLEGRAQADPRYEANTGMFGGWTAALMLKAVLEHPDRQGTASAMTVNFVGRIAPGEELSLAPRRLGGSRSVTHWRCDLGRAETGELLATATIVLAQRRDTEQATDFAMPMAAAPSNLPISHPPGPFGQRTEIRAFYGDPPFARPDMRSTSWVRETTGRAVDAIQLAYISDVYAPRIFFIGPGPRPSSTVTLSIYFLAGPEEIAGIGDDFVLLEAEGTRIEQAHVGSQLRIWSAQGALLATSEQLCWFR